MDFQKYLDLSGDGGIEGFIILPTAIVILFDNGFWYTYNYTRPGNEHVEEMKRLARIGKGLKTYINKNVRNNYANKSDDPPLAA